MLTGGDQPSSEGGGKSDAAEAHGSREGQQSSVAGIISTLGSAGVGLLGVLLAVVAWMLLTMLEGG